MKQNRWKKIIGIMLLLGVLIFSFWYGGNAPGLQGFSVDSSVDEDSRSEAYTESEVNDSSVSDNQASDKYLSDRQDKNTGSDNIFDQIIMKVKRIGSSKRAGKNNPQLNKKAVKNANKSIDKRKKKSGASKKSDVAKNQSDGRQDIDARQSNGNNNTESNSAYNSTENNTENNSEDNTENNSAKNDNVEDINDNNADDSNNIDADISQTDDTEELSTEADTDKDSSPQEPQSITCTIYISCASVLDHMDKLSDSAKKVIPDDGVILDLTDVKVASGATVFDVLEKAAREQKVHLEYNYTPAYKTYYIEGIGNLYQFDAGNLSGWMYSVNGTFPGVGCSGYKVKDGDEIRWLYTCSFGRDVGGYVTNE